MDMILVRALDGAWLQYGDQDGTISIEQAHLIIHDLFEDLCNNVE